MNMPGSPKPMLPPAAGGMQSGGSQPLVQPPQPVPGGIGATNNQMFPQLNMGSLGGAPSQPNPAATITPPTAIPATAAGVQQAASKAAWDNRRAVRGLRLLTGRYKSGMGAPAGMPGGGGAPMPAASPPVPGPAAPPGAAPMAAPAPGGMPAAPAGGIPAGMDPSIPPQMPGGMPPGAPPQPGPMMPPPPQPRPRMRTDDHRDRMVADILARRHMPAARNDIGSDMMAAGVKSGSQVLGADSLGQLAAISGFGIGAGSSLGGLAGAGAGAARGNVPEGLGRGYIRGGLTGGGAMLGAGLGHVAAPHLGGNSTLGALLGASAGGVLGWKGSGKLLGKAVGRPKEKEEEKKGNFKTTFEKLAVPGFLSSAPPPPDAQNLERFRQLAMQRYSQRNEAASQQSGATGGLIGAGLGGAAGAGAGLVAAQRMSAPPVDRTYLPQKFNPSNRYNLTPGRPTAGVGGGWRGMLSQAVMPAAGMMFGSLLGRMGGNQVGRMAAPMQAPLPAHYQQPVTGENANPIRNDMLKRSAAELGKAAALTFKTKADHHMHGEDAWNSADQYFHKPPEKKEGPLSLLFAGDVKTAGLEAFTRALGNVGGKLVRTVPAMEQAAAGAARGAGQVLPRLLAPAERTVARTATQAVPEAVSSGVGRIFPRVTPTAEQTAEFTKSLRAMRTGVPAAVGPRELLSGNNSGAQPWYRGWMSTPPAGQSPWQQGLPPTIGETNPVVRHLADPRGWNLGSMAGRGIVGGLVGGDVGAPDQNAGRVPDAVPLLGGMNFSPSSAALGAASGFGPLSRTRVGAGMNQVLNRATAGTTLGAAADRIANSTGWKQGPEIPGTARIDPTTGKPVPGTAETLPGKTFSRLGFGLGATSGLASNKGSWGHQAGNVGRYAGAAGDSVGGALDQFQHGLNAPFRAVSRLWGGASGRPGGFQPSQSWAAPATGNAGERFARAAGGAVAAAPLAAGAWSMGERGLQHGLERSTGLDVDTMQNHPEVAPYMAQWIQASNKGMTNEQAMAAVPQALSEMKLSERARLLSEMTARSMGNQAASSAARHFEPMLAAAKQFNSMQGQLAQTGGGIKDWWNGMSPERKMTMLAGGGAGALGLATGNPMLAMGGGAAAAGAGYWPQLQQMYQQHAPAMAQAYNQYMQPPPPMQQNPYPTMPQPQVQAQPQQQGWSPGYRNEWQQQFERPT